MLHGGRHWLSDPDHPHYMAARIATKHVYGVDPDLTREGGSIPVTLTLQVQFKIYDKFFLGHICTKSRTYHLIPTENQVCHLWTQGYQKLCIRQ